MDVTIYKRQRGKKKYARKLKVAFILIFNAIQYVRQRPNAKSEPPKSTIYELSIQL